MAISRFPLHDIQMISSFNHYIMSILQKLKKLAEIKVIFKYGTSDYLISFAHNLPIKMFRFCSNILLMGYFYFPNLGICKTFCSPIHLRYLQLEHVRPTRWLVNRTSTLAGWSTLPRYLVSWLTKSTNFILFRLNGAVCRVYLFTRTWTCQFLMVLC